LAEGDTFDHPSNLQMQIMSTSTGSGNQQHHQLVAPAAAAPYPSSMMPMTPAIAMPTMPTIAMAPPMYMNPMNMMHNANPGYYNHQSEYNVEKPFRDRANLNKSHSTAGTHTTRSNSLNETFDDSVNSFDSKVCAKPCEGVGRFVGNTVQGFIKGCNSVLDYGENFCLLRNNRAMYPHMYPPPGGPGQPNHHGPAVNAPGSNPIYMDTMNNGAPNSSPSNSSQPKDESLTQKMDQLLKLLQDKESGSLNSPSASVAVDKSESTGGIVAHSPKDPKKKPERTNSNSNSNSNKPPRQTRSDEMEAQAAQLIEMFKMMNPANNHNLNKLNESAISKDSEIVGIGQNALQIDPILEDELNAEQRVPKDFFDHNPKGISIKVVQQQKPSPEPVTTENDDEEEDEVSLGDVSPPISEVTATVSNVKKVNEPTIVRTISKARISKSTKEALAKEAGVINETPAPTEKEKKKEKKASSTQLATSKPSITKNSSAAEGALRSRKTSKVKKIFKDIKNVPKRSKSTGPKKSSKDVVETQKPKKTTSKTVPPTPAPKSSSKKYVLAKPAPVNPRAVNIITEDSKNGPNESIEISMDDPEEHVVANFKPPSKTPSKRRSSSSSKTGGNGGGVDSMGFPVFPTKQSDGDKKGDDLWDSSFTCKENPFASSSKGSPDSGKKEKETETRICAWCRKGGTDEETVKKLKLCSRCQATYYCSPECQSKDWINGHSKTCRQPTSM